MGARYCLSILQIDTDALSNFSSILLRADWSYSTTANSGRVNCGSGILLDLGQWRASQQTRAFPALQGCLIPVKAGALAWGGLPRFSASGSASPSGMKSGQVIGVHAH